MNKKTTNMIAISDDVKKQIVELVLGEPVNVKPEKAAEFEKAFEKILEDFEENEIIHVMNVVSGKKTEDEIFRILIRRMRHPFRTKMLREFIEKNDRKVNAPNYIQRLEMPDADQKLNSICQKELKERFGDKPPEAVKDRLAHELKVVARNKHSAYYLIASLIAKEAKRLHHATFFRGTITSSLIAYTSGFSDVNPMEPEYGGVNLPFEMTREEYEGKEPALEIQCSMAFIYFAQAFLFRELPDYRCLSYPLGGSKQARWIRIYLMKDGAFPEKDPLETKGVDMDKYPDCMFHDIFPQISLIGVKKMERVRYNLFYNEEKVDFNEAGSDKDVPKIWTQLNIVAPLIKALKVRTYEELITALSMAYSSIPWESDAKQMVIDGSLPLADMIGSRDDLFLYLVSIGLERKEAYQITKRVMMGRHLTEEQAAKMREHGAAEWVIDLCEQVIYLFPRAHIAQMIRQEVFRLE